MKFIWYLYSISAEFISLHVVPILTKHPFEENLYFFLQYIGLNPFPTLILSIFLFFSFIGVIVIYACGFGSIWDVIQSDIFFCVSLIWLSGIPLISPPWVFKKAIISLTIASVYFSFSSKISDSMYKILPANYFVYYFW